ncbi:MAG: glycoside hydrolase, partial [Verrucomicrobiales bacterium]|nr:glycoside hydrolase [Verrucomicrobiales bacterium]
RGQSWELITVMRDMKRGSLFVQGDDVYLFGFRAARGDLLLRRSRDGGLSWSEPHDESDGLLRRGTFGGTPNRPVIHDGRIWLAVSGRRVMSAPVESDLLRADSWTLSSRADTSRGPFGKNAVITEAQIVASPETGVVVMPKIGGEAYTALLRAGKDPRKLRDPQAEDWVSFPGGEKKFAAGFDHVTASFFALSNPVLPAYEDSGWPPEMIRNAAALLVSQDLREWRVATIFLETPQVDYEAFQYLSYDIDGDDLIIASRTAFTIGDGKPPRGHDSNLTTFHRIENFRRYLAPDDKDKK